MNNSNTGHHNKKQSPRSLVLGILMEMDKDAGLFADILLNKTFANSKALSKNDRAFMKSLLEGVVWNRLLIDRIIEKHSSVPFKKIRPAVLNILRMGIYQAVFMDSVPDYALIKESQKLLYERKFGNLKGFVSGVLHSVLRGKDTVISDAVCEKALKETERLSLRHSIPEWIIDMWLDAYGERLTRLITESFERIKPISFRLRKGFTGDLGEEYTKSVYLDYAYTAPVGSLAGDIPGFEQGFSVIQDVSSMLAVEAVDFGGNEKVLDVCAAPGGKALLAADYLSDEKAEVLTCDISEKRLIRLKENIRRLHIHNIKTEVRDATVFDEALAESADVVFADVPCSGLGVMGHKRDIKYHATAESIKELTILQKKIVDNAVKYLKPGGIMIYSTCTVSPEENEKMAEYIRQSHGLKPEISSKIKDIVEKQRKVNDDGIKTVNSPENQGEITKYLDNCLNTLDNGYIQLLPGIFDCDGFFIAGFRKNRM